jgi:hypothetical protein
VDGWFGGVLRMLEALWEFICAVVSAIADAVMKALSFIADVIISIVMAIVEAVVDPVVDAINDWANNLLEGIEALFEQHSCSLAGCSPEEAARLLADMIFSGWFFYLVLGLSTGVIVAGYTVTAMSLGIAGLFGQIADIVFRLVAALVIGMFIRSVFMQMAALLKIVFDAIPGSDPFWSEDMGIGLIDLMTAWITKPPGIKVWDSDSLGLLEAFAGVFLSAISLGLTGELSLVVAGIGLLLAFDGILNVFKDGPNDNPANAFSRFEEVLASVSLGIALADFAKVTYDYGTS